LAVATVHDHHTLPTPVSTADACFYCRRLFLPPTLSLDVVFDYRQFLPLRLNFYGYLHRRRNRRFLPSPLATASIRNRHGCRNCTRRDRNPDACRNLSTPFSVDAVFYGRREISKFLPTPFVFYRHRFLSTTYAIAVAFDSYRFLPLPQPVDAVSMDAAFYRCRCYRHRLLSTPLAIETACYRHRLLSTPLAIDTACFRHRLLPLSLLPPFSTAIATTAILREVALCILS
jgi:hypothetical protein